MYISIGTLAVGYTIVTTASAFYPYEPASGHVPTTSSTKARRAHRALASLPSVSSTTRSITFPLHLQRRDNKYDVINSNDPKQNNSVAVDQDRGDNSYMVAVTIGDSKEEYKLLLDSAASNTWVMGEECPTEACGKHNTFGKSDSTTIKTDSKTFSISYGTGSVSGTTASDTLHIGTSLSTTLAFGIAINVSSEFLSYPMDGIMGMGRGTKSEGTIGTPQIVEALSANQLISSKLYGLHLGRANDGKNDGELSLGEVNKDRFDGDLNWLSAIDNNRGFWEVAISDVGFGTKTLGLSNKTGIVDTGTSYFFIPQPEAIALHELIDGSTQNGENFQVPCSTDQPVVLRFGSTNYNMSSVDWVGNRADSGLCQSKIIGRTTFGANQWLVGDAFLKNVYVAFDYDNAKVGFGVKSTGGSSQASGTSSSASPTAKPTGSSGAQTGSTPAATSGANAGATNAGAQGAGVRTVASASAFALSMVSCVFAVLI